METTGLPPRYGGRLCLDFANTVDARAMAEHEEHLHTYADLVEFGRAAGALDEARAAELAQTAANRPTAAQQSLAYAIELREAIFRIFRAVAGGAPPAPADLDTLQSVHLDGLAVARLRPAGAAEQPATAWSWDGVRGADALALPAWLIARCAVELVTAGPVERVKVCASDEGCAGLFLDTSKNRSRRWCSMADCGNEAKFRRQTVRRRATRPPAGR